MGAVARAAAPPELRSASREDGRSCATALRRCGRVPAAPSCAPALRPGSAHRCRHPRSGISATCRQRRCGPSVRHVRSSASGRRTRPFSSADQQLRARDHRGGFVVMDWARRTDPGSRAAHAACRSRSWPKASSAASDEAGADIDALGVLGGEDMAVGRGNAHPPLAVERPHDRRNERLDQPGHRASCPLVPERPGGRCIGRCSGGVMRPPGTTWDNMGRSVASNKKPIFLRDLG